MKDAECPPRDQIEACLRGDAEAGVGDAVASHLAGCARCQSIADELESSGHPLVAVLQRPKPVSRYGSERELGRAVITGKAIGQPPLVGPEGVMPRILGEYVIQQRIDGNMGIVFKALHTKMDRPVAIKVLPQAALADESAVRRFHREIKAVAKLDHPNIVRAYDAREIEGKHLLIMEYLEGLNLAQVLEAFHGPLSIADACEIVRRAALALQCAHEQGLIHRDVKPANLMLTVAGEVKLLDLGLAKFRAPQPGEGDMTGSGMIVGTAPYMAPEQIEDSRHVDIRADIYALGCTLHKLLTNRAPFDAPNYVLVPDILNAHLHQRIPPIGLLRSGMPKGLAPVLRRMLEKNPDRRYSTPAEVAEALAPFAVRADLKSLAKAVHSEVTRCKPDANRTARAPTGSWLSLAVVASLLLIASAALGGRPVWDWIARRWAADAPRVAAQRADPAEIKASPPTLEEERPSERSPGSGGAAASPGAVPSNANAAGDRPREPAGSPVESSLAKPLTNAAGPPSGGVDRGQATAGPVVAQPQEGPAVGPREDWFLAFHNPTPEFTVQAQVDHPDGLYRGGEKIRFAVQSTRAGYLYVFFQSADGSLLCLYPNSSQRQAEISANTIVQIPDARATFLLRVSPPFGRQRFKAVVTTSPIEPGKLGVKSLTEGDVTRLAPEKLREVFREWQKTPAAWADAQVEVQTQNGAHNLPLPRRTGPVVVESLCRWPGTSGGMK